MTNVGLEEQGSCRGVLREKAQGDHHCCHGTLWSVAHGRATGWATWPGVVAQLAQQIVTALAGVASPTDVASVAVQEPPSTVAEMP